MGNLTVGNVITMVAIGLALAIAFFGGRAVLGFVLFFGLGWAVTGLAFRLLRFLIELFIGPWIND